MFLKLQHKTFKLIILSGLLVLGGQSYSQDQADPAQTINDTEMPAKVQAQNEKELEQKEQAIEDHNTQDLEQLLKRYNKDAQKVLNDTDKLHKDDVGTEVKESEIEDMRPSDDPMKLSSEAILKKAKEEVARKKLAWEPAKNDYSGAVRKALAPIQKLSEKELLSKMDEQTVDSPMRPYIDQFPNIIVFAVKLIKDEDALPSIAKIAEDRDRFIYFVGVMVATILFGFFLKRLMHREGRSFIKAAFYFILRIYIMFAVRVYIVYYFFSTELTPAAKVFKQTFM